MSAPPPLPVAAGAPARRALAAAGYDSLLALRGVGRRHLLGMHGVGPKAVGVLEHALAEHGWSLDGDPAPSRTP